jgi:preprotein translocase subunit SecA
LAQFAPSREYERLLASDRRLSNAADAVLVGVAQFSRLRSTQDFHAAAAELRAEAETPPSNVQGILQRLQPVKIDDKTVQRLALAARAAEVSLGYSPWHHQIACALLLMRGCIVQMPNGSGKTLSAGLAAATAALAGQHVHLVTNNDYLAERDLRWMGGIFHLLKIRAGIVFSDQSLYFLHGVLEDDGDTLRACPREPSRFDPSPPLALVEPADPTAVPVPEADTQDDVPLAHETTGAYIADASLEERTAFGAEVLYSRIERLGLRYLRDNLAFSLAEQVLNERDLLIVDECDSVLLDDLRTPLVINTSSSFDSLPLPLLYQIHELALRLERDVDFNVTGKSIELTYDGLDRIRAMTGADVFSEEHSGLGNAVVQALLALHAYRRDEDYIVENDKIGIIESEGGRLVFGRTYTDGLQAAIEIKEGIPVTDWASNKPVARTTITDFVRTYTKVSGMSGMVGPEAEYRQFYNLPVIDVQPFEPARIDHPDLVYRTRREAIEWGIRSVALEAAQRGQPVLVNVPKLSEVSEIAAMLEREGASVQTLDARTVRNLGDESEKIQKAGTPGLITVCSKVAARGTDIVVPAEARDRGGLCVIGFTRSFDRRYDDQLRGRTARHGDPGESRFVVSLEDELLWIFGGARIQGLMLKLGMDEGVPIDSPLITRRIAAAQRSVYRRNYAARLTVVENDEILARHRTAVYSVRQRILRQPDLRAEIAVMIENWVELKLRALVRDPAPGNTMERELLFGRLAPHLETVAIDRILNVRGRKRRQALMKETLEQNISSSVGFLDATTLRNVTLTALDEHWSRYLEFETSARREMSLYGHDSRSLARYARSMEERFDSFFFDAGEQVLAVLLAVAAAQTQVATGTDS